MANKSRKKPKKRLKLRAQQAKKSSRATAIPPRQVAVRAQETAFRLITMMDRGEVAARFLRRYASERKRPGRIADAGRFRELVQAIRREALLVLALQVEAESARRFAAGVRGKTSEDEYDLAKLFREEFHAALGRGLDYSAEELNEFWRDLEVYRTLRGEAGKSPARGGMPFAPKGAFADRCGFLLDSPMLEQARQAAAQFETELVAMASAALRKILSRRERL